ncbi:MAG TPA: FHA domain-containing protein [Aquabacterium sp.]|nr:FHA domain-containing protein [Aquabacterium sp.]
MEKRALIELLDRHDDVIGRYRVGGHALTIGRGLDCDIVLEDPYTAPFHASLQTTDTGWTLHLPPSLNGAWLEGQLLPSGQDHALPPGAELEVGQTRLRLRHPSEALAAEQPLPTEHHRRTSWRRFLPSPQALLLMALVLGWNIASNWIDSPPESPWSSYFDDLLASLGIAAAWGGAWCLINQIFRREMPFWHHLRNGLITYLVVRALMLVFNLTAYAFSVPELASITGWVAWLGIVTACWLSARHIWPKRQNRITVALSIVTLLVMVPQTLKLHSDQHRWLQPLYMSNLEPPIIRVAQPQSTSDFMAQVRQLEPALTNAAKQDEDKPDSPSGEDDD